MKTSKFIAAATLSLLAALGTAQAEEYQGVLDPVSALSRTDVQQQGVAKAHAANDNVPAAAVPMGALRSPRDRSAVRAEAVAAAHDGTQNLEAGAFAGSQIPAHLLNDSAVRSTAGL